jgi:hypothetical protein
VTGAASRARHAATAARIVGKKRSSPIASATPLAEHLVDRRLHPRHDGPDAVPRQPDRELAQRLDPGRLDVRHRLGVEDEPM